MAWPSTPASVAMLSSTSGEAAITPEAVRCGSRIGTLTARTRKEAIFMGVNSSRAARGPPLNLFAGALKRGSGQAPLQPLGESLAFPAVHRAGAPAQVMRVGARHVARRQALERAVLQPRRTQLEAHERDAQPLRGGVAHQADVVERGALRRL